MNQYHDHLKTPLLFHRIYWMIWTPAQIVLGVPGIIAAAKSLNGADIYAVLDFGYALLTCLFMAVYFVAFFSWKLHGWYALMAQLVMNVAYAFASLLVFPNDDRSYAISLVIGTLIRCIPVGIYYCKRRPLFSAKGFNIPAAGMFFSGGAAYQRRQNQQNTQWQQNQPNTQPPLSAQPSESTDTDGERIYTCPECGGQVKQGVCFCVHCGAKLK